MKIKELIQKLEDGFDAVSWFMEICYSEDEYYECSKLLISLGSIIIKARKVEEVIKDD